MKTRVYKYGLLRPTGSAELVREQMRLAHRYRNQMVEDERARRAEMRAAMSEYGDLPALESAAREARAAVAAAKKRMKDERITKRSKSGGAKELRDELKTAMARAKETRLAFHDRRLKLREDVEVQLRCDEINSRAAARRRASRAACGVYWGTYVMVEQAMDAARKMPLYDGVEPNDPGFVRWRREGAVGVQIQKGMPCADVFGGDTRLQIDTVDEAAWWSQSRGERRRKSRTKLRLRVGSDDGRAPVWAEWPMVMHRPLPDGQIMRAAVSLRRLADRERWSVEITVRLPDEWTMGKCGTGAVAVDLGWRATDEGLRVAYWRGEDGGHGELVLDGAMVAQLTKAASLQGIRDRLLDTARAKLLAWRSAAHYSPPPPWFVEATQTIAQWRSAARYAALARRWRKERWDGDGEGYEALEAWRYRDHHLWSWQENQRRKALGHRREMYRIFAAETSGRYGTVVLEDFNLSEVARCPRVGDDADEGEQQVQARAHRQLAAVSELRSALTGAFVRRGGEVSVVPAPGTTIVCHLCGHAEPWDAAEQVEHTCAGCGESWDQDHNACRNMLALHRERSGGDGKPGGARDGENGSENKEVAESKWARVARLKAEKDERQRAARKPVCNAAE